MLSALALGAVVASQGDAGAGTWPAQVTRIQEKPGGTVTLSGDLATGSAVDLAFAARSSVACFPATENLNFQGNHVLYATSIPKQSEMRIEVVPDDPKTDVSLYAYTIGSSDYAHVPPNVPSAVSCEASYDAVQDHNPGARESVKLVATTHPYNVVIGVAGTRGTSTGKFHLSVTLTGGGSSVASAKLTPIRVDTASGKTASVKGDLAKGGVVDLGWAANSSVACFPATENDNFAGNHVVYLATLPAQSEMVVKAIPKDPSVDLSVYAYSVSSSDTTSVPPNVASAVSCEAGYDQKHDHNPGQAESAKLVAVSHPYNVFIGVAGAKGVTRGSYELQIDVHPR